LVSKLSGNRAFLCLQRKLVCIMPHSVALCQAFFSFILLFLYFFDNLSLNMPKKPDLPPLNLYEESLGHRIGLIRKKKGLTQQELADKIGISRSLLSNYEIDRNRLYDEMLIRLAIALDVSLDYLVGFKDDPEPLPKK